jgi:hypothetical protein
MKRLMLSWMAGFAAAALLPVLSGAAGDTLTLPAGSALHVRLTTTLSTRTNQNGDPWMGRVVEPVFGNGQEVVPAGSTVEGRITFVKEPGHVKGAGQMRLVAETITTPDEGARYLIVASLEDAQGAEGAKVKGEEGTIQGPGKSKKGAAIDAGIGAGVGAATGAIVHGGSGALYGVGAGAVAALIRGLFKRGRDVTLPQGMELTFVISRTTTAKRVSPPPADNRAQ